MDHTRDPCPWVALNDFGGAFCMGVCVPICLYHVNLIVNPNSQVTILLGGLTSNAYNTVC